MSIFLIFFFSTATCLCLQPEKGLRYIVECICPSLWLSRSYECKCTERLPLISKGVKDRCKESFSPSHKERR